MVNAMADLFVAGEKNPHRSVFDLRIFQQMVGQFHDDGDAGLVIASQQRGAVGGNDRFPLASRKFGAGGGRDYFGGVTG